MHISTRTRRWVQTALVLAILGALLRLGLIWRARHTPAPPTVVVTTLPPEAYVAPKKLYAYDLKSARQITKYPVWVKEGYKYVYYAFDRARRRSDFSKEIGRLGPIERLEVKDVVLDASPRSSDQRQVMAVFEKRGNSYAFPVGAERQGDYQIYIDEILFIEDPHQLYALWPTDVWHAIEHGEVKAGMTELQVSFAVGVGLLEGPVRSEERVLRYPNGGNPVVVTYRKGKAVNVSHPNSPLERV